MTAKDWGVAVDLLAGGIVALLVIAGFALLFGGCAMRRDPNTLPYVGFPRVDKTYVPPTGCDIAGGVAWIEGKEIRYGARLQCGSEVVIVDTDTQQEVARGEFWGYPGSFWVPR